MTSGVDEYGFESIAASFKRASARLDSFGWTPFIVREDGETFIALVPYRGTGGGVLLTIDSVFDLVADPDAFMRRVLATVVEDEDSPWLTMYDASEVFE